MFKVGDRVRTLVSSNGIMPGDLGVVTGYVNSTKVMVRFEKYRYPTDTGYHGIYEDDLNLTQPAKPKGISAFIKKWEKEYAKTA